MGRATSHPHPQMFSGQTRKPQESVELGRGEGLLGDHHPLAPRPGERAQDSPRHLEAEPFWDNRVGTNGFCRKGNAASSRPAPMLGRSLVKPASALPCPGSVLCAG